MTVKTNDLPTSNLNINEIEQNTPPNSHELGSGKEGESNEIPVNFYIIKLVSRLLEMADEDYSLLTPIDRETLRDVLACGSIAKVAKKQHQSESNIRIKTNKAIDALNKQMKVWQAPHQRLMEQGKLIQVLSKALDNEKKNRELVKKLTDMLDVQAHKYSMLEAENRALKQEIINLKTERPLMDSQSLNSYVKADEKTTRMLRHTLEEIKISSKLANKLKAYNVETVYDLVRYNRGTALSSQNHQRHRSAEDHPSSEKDGPHPRNRCPLGRSLTRVLYQERMKLLKKMRFKWRIKQKRKSKGFGMRYLCFRQRMLL